MLALTQQRFFTNSRLESLPLQTTRMKPLLLGRHRLRGSRREQFVALPSRPENIAGNDGRVLRSRLRQITCRTADVNAPW